MIRLIQITNQKDGTVHFLVNLMHIIGITHPCMELQCYISIGSSTSNSSVWTTVRRLKQEESIARGQWLDKFLLNSKNLINSQVSGN